MEPGPPPILTSAGILLLYDGADQHLVYGPAWDPFDRKDPARLLACAEGPFMLPKLEWERVGNVPNVIFLEGAVRGRTGGAATDQIELTGYYGGPTITSGRCASITPAGTK